MFIHRLLSLLSITSCIETSIIFYFALELGLNIVTDFDTAAIVRLLNLAEMLIIGRNFIFVECFIFILVSAL